MRSRVVHTWRLGNTWNFVIEWRKLQMYRIRLLRITRYDIKKNRQVLKAFADILKHSCQNEASDIQSSCNMASYLNITSWSHKKLIDLIRAEFPKDVLWGEMKIKLVEKKIHEKKPNSKIWLPLNIYFLCSECCCCFLLSPILLRIYENYSQHKEK